MITHFAQCAKSITASGANAHGGVRLHHHSSATGLTGAVDNVSHEVQTGLQEQTVITSKQILIHQLLHLQNKSVIKTGSLGGLGIGIFGIWNICSTYK